MKNPINFILIIACFSFCYSSSYSANNEADSCFEATTLIDKEEAQSCSGMRWVDYNGCDKTVRVDNGCNYRVWFRLVLNNCSGYDCVRCYYVNPGAYLYQDVSWCSGVTFYWGC